MERGAFSMGEVDGSSETTRSSSLVCRVWSMFGHGLEPTGQPFCSTMVLGRNRPFPLVLDDSCKQTALV